MSLKKESPRHDKLRGQRKTDAGQATALKEVYAKPVQPASHTCPSCLYYRFIQTARFNKIFCAFTGEKITAGWTCSFWTPSLGGPLEW